MGLLSDPSQTSQPGKFLTKLKKYGNIICWTMVFVGVCWFGLLAHSSLNNSTYFSENALLPGLVYSKMPAESVNLARNLLGELERERETHKTDIPYAWLLAKMRQIGLDTNTHNFTLHYPLAGGKIFKGKNVYGILRAPQIGSTESIVITAPYRPPNSMHPAIYHSIPLLLAVADYARRNKFWAKDLIFLVVDQEQLGMQAWMEAYYGSDESSVLDFGTLESRAGSIQAAINLEIQDFSVDTIDIKIEGINGQLPNLDLFNLVHKLATKENIRCGYKESQRLRGQSKNTYRTNLMNMLSMVITQSSGVPTGNHGLFHRYGIEAVTLEAHKKSNTGGGGGGAGGNNSNQQRTNSDLFPLLKLIEGILRSLNNLLERFHQSYFFYLIVANNRFVSIGDYMPSLALMAGSLFVKSFILWLSLNDEEDKLRKNQNAIEYNNSNKMNVMHIGLVIFITHGIGLVAFNIPFITIVQRFLVDQLNLSTEQGLFTTFCAICLISCSLPIIFPQKLMNIKIIHILVLLEIATGLIVIGMLNFSFGIVLCAIIVPLALIIRPPSQLLVSVSTIQSSPISSSMAQSFSSDSFEKSIKSTPPTAPAIESKTTAMRITRQPHSIAIALTKAYCLILNPLIVVYAIVFILTQTAFPELAFIDLAKRTLIATMNAITYSIVDYSIYGNWVFAIVTLILFPGWILFWSILNAKTECIKSKIE